jgi:hypothetical protein
MKYLHKHTEGQGIFPKIVFSELFELLTKITLHNLLQKTIMNYQLIELYHGRYPPSTKPPLKGERPKRRTREGGSEWELIKILFKNSAYEPDFTRAPPQASLAKSTQPLECYWT